MRIGTYSEVMVLQDAVAATTLADGESFPLSCQLNPSGAWEAVGIQMTGVTTATVEFEGTIDGTNWVSVGVTDVDDWATVVTQATADGIWVLRNPKGLTYLRVRITVNTTGAVTVTAQGVA